MRAIVAGGRDFTANADHEILLKEIIEKYHVDEIVCGMARGADMFGYRIAKQLNLKIKEFPANWDKYKKSAGYKRNVEMGDYADKGLCILFPGGKGTAHMKNIAIQKKLIVIEIA